MPKTGAPRALMDASAITDMGTGAVDGARGRVSGAAEPVARSAISGHAVPVLERAPAESSFRSQGNPHPLATFGESERLATTLQNELGRRVIAVSSWEEAVADADIIVEASRLLAPEPLLKTSWIKRGAFVVPYGTMSAVELSLTDIMAKLVVDDWGQCKTGRFGALRPHVEAGKLTETTLHAELGSIVAGLKPGRQSEDETILLWHRGLSSTDIALGHALLQKAHATGVGQKLRWA